MLRPGDSVDYIICLCVYSAWNESLCIHYHPSSTPSHHHPLYTLTSPSSLHPHITIILSTPPIAHTITCTHFTHQSSCFKTSPPHTEGGTHPTASIATTDTSLTTPIMSLVTPSLLGGNLFSSIMGGEFPFNSATGPGSEMHSALVAFPVSIQPTSGAGSNSTAGNIILQAQNMGQPFLLTPSYDRQNSVYTSQVQLPANTFGAISPGSRDVEQLKMHYEKIQQHLLLSQALQSAQTSTVMAEAGHMGRGEEEPETQLASQPSQFLNSDVMMSSQTKEPLPSITVESDAPPPSKKQRRRPSSDTAV